MPILESGVWVPDLFGKQWLIFNCYKRALLVSGPREAAKTWGVLHKIIRHMWETPSPCRVACFSRVIKDSKQAGVWKLFEEVIVPEWVKADIGLKYTTEDSYGRPGPKVDGTTRTPVFRITNMHGGESECMLFSLEHARDAEKELKEKTLSMIYFSELDKFDDQGVLSVALSCLRMSHLKKEQMMWIADTNPSEQGQKFWAYRTFFEERVWSYEEYVYTCGKENRKPLPEPDFIEQQKDIELIEMTPEENERLAPGRLKQLKADNSYDPIRYARLVEGKWVWGLGNENYHFKGIFKPEPGGGHVIGNCDAPDERDWEYANPSVRCFELVSGWDIGDGVNHAAVFIEADAASGRKCFTVLDELESIGEKVSTEDFALEGMEKVKGLEKIAGHPLDLERAWSDNSSFDYSAAADDFPYLQVSAASGGRINLIGLTLVEKNQKIRVQLVKQLLSQGRLKISAHCKAVIRSLENLKRGDLAKSSARGTSDWGRSKHILPDENKHIFDAPTYALIKECAEELAMMNLGDASVGRRDSFVVGV